MSNTTMTRDATASLASSTAAARRAMIDSQLRTSGVNEEFVLARMLAVPREDFLPAHKADLAYIDRSIALGPDAFLAAPLFYGKLLLEAAPRSDDRVLLITGGTDYLAELTRPLVDTLTVISAGDAVRANLSEGAFTLVLIDGAIEELPDAIASSLEEGGRIVAGLLLRKVTRLGSGRKIAGQVSLQPVEDLGIPVLRAFDRPKSWTFS